MAALAATREYQRGMVALRALTYRDLTKLWTLLDMERLDDSYPEFAAAVATLVQVRRRVATSLARDYLSTVRSQAGASGPTPEVAQPALPLGDLMLALRLSSVISVKIAMTRQTPLDRASRNALIRTMGTADKFIGDAGREYIRAAVEADPEAQGWVRRTLGTCDYCAEQASGEHVQAGDADFPRHDHCGCQPEPVYGKSFEPKFVENILRQLAVHDPAVGIAELERLLSTELNELARANVTEALARLKAQVQGARAGTIAEKFPIPDDVLALFKQRSWSPLRRDKMFEALKTRPEGGRLAKVIEKFQSLSARSIPLLRTDIEKYLAGETLAAGRAADIEALLSAIGNARVEAKVLHRGMSIPGRLEDVMARYQVGEEFDISLGSFTTDRYVAERFAGGKTYGKTVRAGRKVSVRVEWVGDGKHALNIQNTALNSVIAAEKEYLAAGKFVIEKVRHVGGSVVVTIRQVRVW